MKGHKFTTEQLARGCARLGIALTPQQQARLCGHLQLLEKWNRRLNLTAIRGDAMVARHLLDSLTILPFVGDGTVLDIGSGGGFPGIPLAIANPRLRVTLLDSRGKRVEFLRAVCAHLDLDNVQVVKERVEEYRPVVKFDTLTTRAFAPLADTLQKTVRLHCPGSRLLAMKGKMPTQEITQLRAGRHVTKRVAIEKLRVPFLAAERHLIIIEF